MLDMIIAFLSHPLFVTGIIAYFVVAQHVTNRTLAREIKHNRRLISRLVDRLPLQSTTLGLTTLADPKPDRSPKPTQRMQPKQSKQQKQPERRQLSEDADKE